MASLDELLDRLEGLLVEVEQLDEPLRGQVFELLDGVDTLHRVALGRLAAALGPEELQRVRDADPAVAWLFDAYDLQPPPPPEPVRVQLSPTRRR